MSVPAYRLRARLHPVMGVMNKILVTGGTGFIGQELVASLKKQGFVVRLLLRNEVAPAVDVDEVFYGDLTDPVSLQAVADGCDTIFHLAGYAHAHSRPDPVEVERHRRINLEGTRAILQQANMAGVARFIYVSSVKAGGESTQACIDEDHSLEPEDPYGIIKRQCELAVLRQAEASGMHACVIRPALVYGKGVKGNLAAMARWVGTGFFPPLCDTGNNRSMVEVRDVVVALLAAARNNQACGNIYIITDGESYSTHRIYTAMRSAAGKPIPAWCVPAFVLRALGVIGDLLTFLLRRPLPLNRVTVARLLDSACYRSAHAEQDLAFTARYQFEDVAAEIVSEAQNKAVNPAVRAKDD